MISKLVEIRDSATFIPVIATLMTRSNPEQAYLLARAGYSPTIPVVLLTHAHGGRIAYFDPYDWGDRTYQVAHQWIEQNFNSIKDGDVIDVQFILGETEKPKRSEREESFEHE